MSILTGSFRWYSSGTAYVLSDPGQLLTNDLRVILLSSSYVFDTGHQYYDTHITDELPTAAGYTTGGVVLTNKALSPAVDGSILFMSDNVYWIAAGGALTARSWAMYDDTPVTDKPLIAFGSLNHNAGNPSDVSSTVEVGIILTANGWFKFLPQDNP